MKLKKHRENRRTRELTGLREQKREKDEREGKKVTSSPSSTNLSPDQRAYKRGRPGRQTREPPVDKQRSKKTREQEKKKDRETKKKKTETKRGKASASTTSSLRLRQEQRGVSSNSRLHRRHLRQQSLKPVTFLLT
ncbi:hypothetical protein NC653_039040 [Populus alba x Populus x berolinensis]|uniref:Uncharacterized protein n=1 Tax=Populus alba x Populus x berolinensis TaxID=444605 RepID=A0AAD6PQ24_9ROSI|nr:hypothetical protein NC653_039040 [Populus alba x Populus x berolinensis]